MRTSPSPSAWRMR